MKLIISGVLILIAMSALGDEMKDNVLLGCYYFPGWYRKGGVDYTPPPVSAKSDEWNCWDEFGDHSEWRWAIAGHPYPRPLLGFYDDSLPEVWNTELGWAADHGVDFMIFDWYYNDGVEYLSRSLDRGYLGSKLKSRVKFCLNWCNHSGYWWTTPIDQSGNAMVEMIEYVAKKYFSQPEYLKIDDKPVFMIYEQSVLLQYQFPNELKNTFGRMRNAARKAGFPGLYLIGCYSEDSPAYLQHMKNIGYNAFAAYTYCFQRGPYSPGPSAYYSDVVKETASIYPYLKAKASATGLDFIPTVAPGWDNSPRLKKDAYVVVGSGPALFERQCRQALNCVDKKQQMVLVEAWNEWGEGAVIAPDKQHGFKYLDVLRNVFTSAEGEHTDRLPSESNIAAWTILNEDERKAAEVNEKLAYDIPKPPKTQPLIDRPDPDGQLVWDLRKASDRQKLTCSIKPQQAADGLVIASESAVMLSTSTFQASIPDVESIEIKLIASGKSEVVNTRLFWKTSKSAGCENYYSTQIPVIGDGKSHTYIIRTTELRTWAQSSGELIGLDILFDNPSHLYVELIAVNKSDQYQPALPAHR